MEIVNVLSSEGSQAVRIPKEYHFSVDKVYVNKVGDALVLTPVNKLREVFDQGLADFTDDFMADGRPGEALKEGPETT